LGSANIPLMLQEIEKDTLGVSNGCFKLKNNDQI